MPSCAQRLTVFGDTWRSSATCAVRRYLGWVVWGNALSRSCCRPRFGDDPMPVGVGCHRAFYTGWPSSDASRCSLGSPAGAFMDVGQSVVVGPGASLATYRRGARAATGRHRHRRAARHARTRTVVTGSGRSRYCAPGRGACSASRPAGRACSLATGARVGPALAIPPRRWREGQVHDGWNREMVQRR
jgi:hypothetical protein